MMIKEQDQIRRDSTIREHFSGNTELYVDKYESSYRELCRNRLDFVDRYLRELNREDLAILDVGGGAGVFIDMFLERFPKARACCADFSSGMLDRNKRAPSKALVAADARALPFRPASFDVIDLDALLHHVISDGGYLHTIDGIAGVLASLHRLLKPNGILLIREIYHEYILKDNLGSYLLYTVTTRRMPAMVTTALKRLGVNTANVGVCFLTRRQWSKALARAGYTLLESRESRWHSSRYRYAGFLNSGDLFYVLR